MTRRTFLARVFGVAAVAAVAPAVPVLAARPTPPPLAFRRDAFALDFDSGIAVRFVKHFDIRSDVPTRFDVWYGAGMPENLACRVLA